LEEICLDSSVQLRVICTAGDPNPIEIRKIYDSINRTARNFAEAFDVLEGYNPR